MVMALYAIAELIEAGAVDRARNAIKGLIDWRPRRPTCASPTAAGCACRSPALPLDAIVRVQARRTGRARRHRGARPQRRDQAPVTGESIPVDKRHGRSVFAGTINQAGEIEFRVTAGADDTHAGAHHPRGRGSPGHARADPALRRPLRRDLHAERVRAGAGGGAAAAAAVRRPWLAAPLQGAGAAGHRLPLRAGDLHAGDGGERPGRRGAARHPDQGRQLPGGRAPAEGDRARQDRHAHRRQAAAGRNDGAGARSTRPNAPVGAIARSLAAVPTIRCRRRLPQAAAQARAATVDAFKALPGRGVEGRSTARSTCWATTG